jgi:hypothetical protein
MVRELVQPTDVFDELDRTIFVDIRHELELVVDAIAEE